MAAGAPSRKPLGFIKSNGRQAALWASTATLECTLEKGTRGQDACTVRQSQLSISYCGSKRQKLETADESTNRGKVLSWNEDTQERSEAKEMNTALYVRAEETQQHKAAR